MDEKFLIREKQEAHANRLIAEIGRIQLAHRFPLLPRLRESRRLVKAVGGFESRLREEMGNNADYVVVGVFGSRVHGYSRPESDVDARIIYEPGKCSGAEAKKAFEILTEELAKAGLKTQQQKAPRQISSVVSIGARFSPTMQFLGRSDADILHYVPVFNRRRWYAWAGEVAKWGSENREQWRKVQREYNGSLFSQEAIRKISRRIMAETGIDDYPVGDKEARQYSNNMKRQIEATLRKLARRKALKFGLPDALELQRAVERKIGAST